MQAPQNQMTEGTPDTRRMGPRQARWVLASVMLSAAALAGGIGFLRYRSLAELSATPVGRARADILYLEKLARHFTRVVGQPPTEEQGLQALVEVKVVSQIPLDPWGRPYVYKVIRGTGRVISLGRDGVPGGEGEDADIRSADTRGP
jgi:general secretion pathway protein G